MTSVDEEQDEARVPSQIRPGAIAERTLSATLSPNQLVDLTNQETRFDLLRSTPQVNQISADRGNSSYLSGGASLANALILSSSTTLQAKANSKALFKIVAAFHEKDRANGLKKPFSLSVEEEIALRKLESGKMTPIDGMHLQQILYRLSKRTPYGQNSNFIKEELTTSQLASTIAMLRSNGAFLGSSITLHCQRLMKGIDHWTTSVDGIYVNGRVGSKNKSVVMGVSPEEVNPEDENWHSEIHLDTWSEPSTLTVKFRCKQDAGPQYQTVVLDATKYDCPGKLQDFEADLLTPKK